MKHLGFSQESPKDIYVYNRSAITLAKNLVYHHFVREHVKEKEVELVHCKSFDQIDDIFTCEAEYVAVNSTFCHVDELVEALGISTRKFQRDICG